MQNESPEDALRRRLKEILPRPDLPAFSQNIQQILRYAGNEDTSVRNITNIVLREYSISLRLLRAANSPLYNRSGKPILSVSHAASLLGLQAIRDLAAGTMFFEHFRNRSPGLRQLMFLSLLTANHAREAASLLGYPHIEEAYLCGMFRNLGEVLVASYLDEDYNRILTERKQPKYSEKHAVKKVLRFTYEDLGRAMVEHWGLPEAVKETLRECFVGTARLRPHQGEFLTAVVGLSHRLTDLVYRQDAPSPAARIENLRDAFHRTLGVTTEHLESILEAAVRETKEASRNLSIPFDTLRLKQQLEKALVLPLAAAGPEEEFLSSLLRQVESGEYELQDLLLSVLEKVTKECALDRALFCLVDPASNSIHGRVGFGAEADTLLRSFHFPLSLRGGPIALAILRKHDLFQFGEKDLRFDRSAFLQKLGSASFLLCPVIVDGMVIGCLYGDRKQNAPLEPRTQLHVAKLRDLAGEAIKRRRASSEVYEGVR
ncbi:MAG: HDOD domain-containing protein [Bryobacterales bacterium]|nr:HDOD domain-containing protein [Bryobacterales bacterium]